MFPVPCSTPRAIRAWLMENLQAQEIALTQLNLTLASCVCRPCCNDTRRLINSASITPRWEKGGTRPNCCINNCHATSFATSKLQLVSKYLKSFHALLLHVLHYCVSGITILCMTQFSLNKHCFTCSSSLRNCRMRVCPNPKLVQQVLGERTGFEETIPASARVCAPCYKAHMLIIKEGSKSIDQDLIQLITDLKRGIPSSDTIKMKSTEVQTLGTI